MTSGWFAANGLAVMTNPPFPSRAKAATAGYNSADVSARRLQLLKDAIPRRPCNGESRPAARLRLLFREISAELSKLPRPLQKPPLPLLLFFCGRRRVSELIDLLACKVDGLRCGFRASPLHELRSCQPQLDKPTDGLGAVRFVGLPRCPSVHIFTQFGRKPDRRHWVSPSGRPASLFSHYVFA